MTIEMVLVLAYILAPFKAPGRRWVLPLPQHPHTAKCYRLGLRLIVLQASLTAAVRFVGWWHGSQPLLPPDSVFFVLGPTLVGIVLALALCYTAYDWCSRSGWHLAHPRLFLAVLLGAPVVYLFLCPRIEGVLLNRYLIPFCAAGLLTESFLLLHSPVASLRCIFNWNLDPNARATFAAVYGFVLAVGVYLLVHSWGIASQRVVHEVRLPKRKLTAPVTRAFRQTPALKEREAGAASPQGESAPETAEPASGTDSLETEDTKLVAASQPVAEDPTPSAKKAEPVTGPNVQPQQAQAAPAPQPAAQQAPQQPARQTSQPPPQPDPASPPAAQGPRTPQWQNTQYTI